MIIAAPKSNAAPALPAHLAQAPPITGPSARFPSHFGSHAQPSWSAGSSRAAVGCIGRNPAGATSDPAAAPDPPRTGIPG